MPAPRPRLGDRKGRQVSRRTLFRTFGNINEGSIPANWHASRSMQRYENHFRSFQLAIGHVSHGSIRSREGAIGGVVLEQAAKAGGRGKANEGVEPISNIPDEGSLFEMVRRA